MASRCSRGVMHHPHRAELGTRGEKPLREQQESLVLRRKFDIHKTDERKNLHINDLMKNHDKAFTQITNYNNDITKGNLWLIASLKNEIAVMKKKAAANTKPRARRVAEEQEVEHLRHELKDVQKNKLSLRNAKARLMYLAQQVHDLKQRQAERTTKYRTMESDRNVLYDTFEHAIQTIPKEGECKNLILEQCLYAMDDQHARKGAQVQEVLLAANLDLVQARRVIETLGTLLDSKNTKICNLQYNVAKESKAYNDTLRTFTEKLIQIGIPEEEN
ncbi:hypothetical protein PHYSODRAFT_263859 [Phytophthora sojae]|uniref:Growth arrest-specific protein 8 domain-containing protein n=1 Tax=Phytophthora sojae (strain P6497) TaxID=1094619 RepID=G4ZMA4_PHYSP|nr:hypothetical protein PHYSODRAFT_263859 [Phytophthora sojae]EGZ14637.1 hypothetical protein PHYSODRAFT_263859 [Phytophthora sojae]|eukprot:XP_009528386.1 hypothetical protein PHYSODRAFT_263859 [Phytophthora sojae]